MSGRAAEPRTSRTGPPPRARRSSCSALGEPAVTEALNPQSTLASAESRTQAASALGEGIQPSLIFQVPTLVSLLEGVGLTEDPTLSPRAALRARRPRSQAAATSLGGEVERFKLVAASAEAFRLSAQPGTSNER